MSTRSKLAGALALGATAALLIGGCPLTPAPSSDPADFTNASQVRGGLLYDKWWSTANLTAPTTDHPLWASRPDTASNSRSGADTWRCKECHGWDYQGVNGAYVAGSHRTGIAGIFGTMLSAQETFDLIKTNHSFGDAGLSDADIWDLAKFVKEGQVNVPDLIDSQKNFVGSAADGQTLYDNGVGTNTACTACHGADGTTINFKDAPDEEFLGDLARGNPWETFHKIRYGHPGSQMPSSVDGGGSTQDAADIGAYAQTLATDFMNADTVRGGLMYDKWWAVAAGASAPTSDHPLWASRPDTASNARTGADTWRCKECHGWDYKGVDGAYGSGSHRTGIKGIYNTSMTSVQIFDRIKNNHGFGAAGLSDADIWDLTRFVKDGTIDTDTMIDGNGMFTGDTAAGMTLYDSGIGTSTACAACHGADGLATPPGAGADHEDFVGLIANENPWEFQHKVRFGQPSTAMPSSVTGGGSDQDVNDLGAFAQSLPTEITMAGGDATAGQTFYNDNNCATCHAADASGGFGPNLAGTAGGVILNQLDGTNTHTGGTVSGVTQQNADDLAAWLAG